MWVRSALNAYKVSTSLMGSVRWYLSFVLVMIVPTDSVLPASRTMLCRRASASTLLCSMFDVYGMIMHFVPDVRMGTLLAITCVSPSIVTVFNSINKTGNVRSVQTDYSQVDWAVHDLPNKMFYYIFVVLDDAVMFLLS